MAISLGDLSKVPAKQKIFLVVLACAMILVGYYYLYLQDARKSIASQESTLAGLQAKITEQQRITRDLASFQAVVKDLERQLTILLEQLPNSAEIPSLLRSISDLGKESGLEFLKFAPKGETRKGFYAEIPVSIAVVGDYHSFVLFTDKVGHLPRIVNIANIDVGSPKANVEGLMNVNVSCSATTYRFVEQEGAKAADPDKKKGPADSKGKAK